MPLKVKISNQSQPPKAKTHGTRNARNPPKTRKENWAIAAHNRGVPTGISHPDTRLSAYCMLSKPVAHPAELCSMRHACATLTCNAMHAHNYMHMCALIKGHIYKRGPIAHYCCCQHWLLMGHHGCCWGTPAPLASPRFALHTQEPTAHGGHVYGARHLTGAPRSSQAPLADASAT